jgi:hypothetical protein
MSISLSYLKDTFGGSNPIRISDYYQGGNIMGPGVYPATVPASGIIALSAFSGVPQQHNWGHNQRTSGDQGDDGCGWTVDYINGPLGWGLYATVWYLSGGQQVSPLTAAYTSQFIKFTTANVVVTSNPTGVVSQTHPPGSTGNHPQAGPTGGTLSVDPDSLYGDGIYFMGYITGYWDGVNTVYINGGYGVGSPGDTGYAYAVGQSRANWVALGGGSNTVAVVI